MSPGKAYNSTQLNCCVLTRRHQLVMSPGHYDVMHVESVFVVDTLDVTRNRDVSLDCACSADKVYCYTKVKSRQTILI